MKAYLLALVIGATSQPFGSQDNGGSGIAGAVLLDADGVDVPATSKAMQMERAGFMNQMSWLLDVTWGTSTYMLAKCKVSADKSNYGWVPYCSDASTAQCEPQVWRFDATDYANGEINFNVRNPGKFMICQFWSPAGTGTISAHGNRSSQ